MAEDRSQAVIFDVGSGFTRAGVAGDAVPCSIFPTLVARPWHGDTKESWYGYEAYAKRNQANIISPVKDREIVDWDNIEKVWHGCFFGGCKVTPEEHSCIITEPANNPSYIREKTTTIMFEIFNVADFYLGVDAAFALIATGRSTGIVLDSGYGTTHAVPVYEGSAVVHTAEKIPIAGLQIDQYLRKILAQVGYHSNNGTFPCDEALNEIKKKCYIAQDFGSEYANNHHTTHFQLPDGHAIQLGNQAFRAPEILFQPNHVTQGVRGVHQLVNDSIQKCDYDLMPTLYKNIVLAGGSTLFAGTKQRLVKQVQGLASSSMAVKAIAAQERNYLAWMGASISSSLSAFRGNWISKAQYEEYGPTIVHTKCY